MYCTDCGASVGDDASYCTECGATLDAEPSSTSRSETSFGAAGEQTADQTANQPGEPTNQGASDQPTTGQEAPGQTATGQEAAGQPATDQPATDQSATDQPATGQPTTQRSREVQQSAAGWATSRKVALGAAALALGSLFLPWVSAVRGGLSANGFATDFHLFILVGAVVAFGAAAVNWGRGWGWLSMLFTGVAGLGVASAAVLFQGIVSETTTMSFMEINGTRVPIAAVEPASGVQVAIAAGALVALAALAGIVGSLGDA